MPSYQIVLDNEWATVRYEPVGKYIYHTFHQPISGDPFRHVLNVGLDFLTANNVQKWLSDDRKNAEFSPEDIAFSVEDWGPRAAKAGWKYWALVVPEDIAARGGMQDIIDTFFDLGVRVAIFTNLEKAENWLEKL